MHPIDIRFIGFIDPFFSGLSDFILYFPLRRLGFASSGDLLDIGHDTIHGRCFSSIIGRTLGSVMARSLHLKHVTDVELLVFPRSL